MATNKRTAEKTTTELARHSVDQWYRFAKDHSRAIEGLLGENISELNESIQQADQVVASLAHAIQIYSGASPTTITEDGFEWPELRNHQLVANINLLEDMRLSLDNLRKVMDIEIHEEHVARLNGSCPLPMVEVQKHVRVLDAVKEVGRVTEVALPWIGQEEALGSIV